MDETESLLTQAGTGDEHAIGALLERHLPGLRAYIRLRMGERVRRWDCESDVAQSVCIEVLGNLEGFTYRGEAAFRQWLYTMARRKLSQRDVFLKAGKRDVDLLETNAVAGDSVGDQVARIAEQAFGSPSENAIKGEVLADMERVLDGMSEDMREVILMSRLAGVSTSEIARKLGKEPSSIRSLLCRGLAQLARDME